MPTPELAGAALRRLVAGELVGRGLGQASLLVGGERDVGLLDGLAEDVLAEGDRAAGDVADDPRRGCAGT